MKPTEWKYAMHLDQKYTYVFCPGQWTDPPNVALAAMDAIIAWKKNSVAADKQACPTPTKDTTLCWA